MAVMALALVGEQRRPPVTKALAWLAGQQLPDGGFPGAAGRLHQLGRPWRSWPQPRRVARTATEIDRAQAFLAGQQNADGGFNVAAGGAAPRTSGPPTQVVGGIVGTPFGTLFDDLALRLRPRPPGRPT